MRRSTETRFLEATLHQGKGHQPRRKTAIVASKLPRQKQFHEDASETEIMHQFTDSRKQSKLGKKTTQ